MSPGRIVALVVGCLLAVVGAGLVVAGGSLGVALATQRDDGFFDVTLDRVVSDASAVTAGDLAFTAEPGTAGWALGLADADVRLRVTTARDAGDAFVGIARAIDVEAYLNDVEHDEVVDLRDGRQPVTERRPGSRGPVPPLEMVIWSVSDAGPSTVEVVWPAQSGRWTVVLMNTDGSPGVAADVEVGLRVGFLVPLAIAVLVSGLVVTVGAVVMIVWAVRRRGEADDARSTGSVPAVVGAPVPAPVQGDPLPPPTPPGRRPPAGAGRDGERS